MVPSEEGRGQSTVDLGGVDLDMGGRDMSHPILWEYDEME